MADADTPNPAEPQGIDDDEELDLDQLETIVGGVQVDFDPRPIKFL